MYITCHHQTNPIDFGEYRMNSFFYRSTKKNSYTLRPMESNSLKCSSIQIIRLIDLKFGKYIIGHHRTNPINFVNVRFFFNRSRICMYKLLIHTSYTAYGIKFLKMFQCLNDSFDSAQIWYVYYRLQSHILCCLWGV